jgi:NAD-dependent deacetylase
MDMIQAAAELIETSGRIVAFTGAGISTEAGIPDFRSPDTGLWETTGKLTQLIAFTSLGFRLFPGAFYRRGLPLLSTLMEAKPTRAHRFLAGLEEEGKLTAVITQNIDGLHQAAGSRTVCELHGHLRSGSCLGCGREYSLDDQAALLDQKSLPPRCGECGGVIKPKVVLFGDSLPMDDFSLAFHHAARAELCIVMGSSLTVTPAAHIPEAAAAHGARLIIINRTPTPLDDHADVVIRGGLEETADAIDAVRRRAYS